MDDTRSIVRALKRRKTSSSSSSSSSKRAPQSVPVHVHGPSRTVHRERFAFTDLLNLKFDGRDEISSVKTLVTKHHDHRYPCLSSSDQGEVNRSPKRKCPKFDLSPKQNDVVTQVLKFKRNVFFTGCAGTGKSAVLFHIKKRVPANQSFFLGPTGISARNIRGMTVHAFAGIGVGYSGREELMRKSMHPAVLQRWTAAKLILIDEISMLDGTMLTDLEYVARTIRKDPRPWGGIQMVFCGDFAQLPFVTKKSKERVFAFETETWKKTVDVSIVLDHVYRQDDGEFVEVLRHIRMGHCPPEVERVLMSRRITEDELEGQKDVMRLFPLRRDVLVENRRRLEELPGDMHEFIAKDWGNPKSLEKLEKSCPVDHWIGLKEGCFVVLLVNLSMSLGLVNGSTGHVVRFAADGNPIVRFGKRETKIEPRTFTIEEDMSLGGGPSNFVNSSVQAKHQSKVIVAKRTQIPLSVGYAMSIHKSQGMTLDSVVLSLSDAFEIGMAYVALSRVRSLENMFLLDFDKEAVRADPRVVRFCSELEPIVAAGYDSLKENSTCME